MQNSGGPAEWPEAADPEPCWWAAARHSGPGESTMLNLSYRNIGDRGAELLADYGLRHFPDINTLLLTGNRIGPRGIKALAQRGLRHCPKLVELALSNNGIGDEGLTDLAVDGLQNCRELRRLLLSSTGVGDGGIEALADHGLRHCPKLSELFLSNNKIGDAGAAALADRGLRHIKLLTHLHLTSNNIGAEGAGALVARGIQNCPELSNLSIPFTSGGGEALAECGLTHCPKLARLFFDDDSVRDEEGVRFVRVLAENPPPALEHLVGISLNRYADELHLPEELRTQWVGNREILSFLRKHPRDVCRRLYASQELQSCRDFVLEAVRQYGRAVRYASKELRCDKEVVMLAVESQGNQPSSFETHAQVSSELERSIDQDTALRMRTWVEEKQSIEVARAMPFAEVHAQYCAYPGSTEEDLARYPDLGWIFRETLQ